MSYRCLGTNLSQREGRGGTTVDIRDAILSCMKPEPRAERDLRNCPIFGSDTVELWKNRENMPWPTPGESLLSDPIGSEVFIFPY